MLELGILGWGREMAVRGVDFRLGGGGGGGGVDFRLGGGGGGEGQGYLVLS